MSSNGPTRTELRRYVCNKTNELRNQLTEQRNELRVSQEKAYQLKAEFDEWVKTVKIPTRFRDWGSVGSTVGYRTEIYPNAAAQKKAEALSAKIDGLNALQRNAENAILLSGADPAIVATLTKLFDDFMSA